eukprot:6675101-Prymnesium_polylepis.1
MVSLDEVVVGRPGRRHVGRREECAQVGKGCAVACAVEGTAGGFSPPADATCGLAGHKIVSQPVQRSATHVPCTASGQ